MSEAAFGPTCLYRLTSVCLWELRCGDPTCLRWRPISRTDPPNAPKSIVGASLLAKAAFGPTWLLLIVYISIAAVTATGGFALTATHFFFKRRNAGPAKK